MLDNDVCGAIEFVTRFNKETNCGTYEEMEYPNGFFSDPDRHALHVFQFKKIKGDDGSDAIAISGIEVTKECEYFYNTFVELPDEIMNLPVIAIEPYASNETCSDVTISGVKIPKTIISVGEGAFADMGDMESVEIPETVKNIGERAFGYCLAPAFDDTDEYEKCEDFVIFCSPGSAAEEYAKKNGFICKPLAE